MRLALIIYRIAKWAVLGLIAALLIGALYSCSTQQKIVPVPEIHEQHHWHTDSVHQTDSIIRETTTTIMQLDSVAMAQYGITQRIVDLHVAVDFGGDAVAVGDVDGDASGGVDGCLQIRVDLSNDDAVKTALEGSGKKDAGLDGAKPDSDKSTHNKSSP